MPKIKSESIDRDLERTKEAVEAIGAKRAAIDGKIEQVLGAQQLAGIEVDLADSDFSALRSNSDAFEANIATLIYGLDEVTKAFGAEFKEMSAQTTGERIIGFFSRKKATEMRTSRVRSTDIRGNLTQLISKSNVIQGMLTGQLATITDRLARTNQGHEKILERSRETAAAIQGLNDTLDRLGPQVSEIQGRLDEASGERRKVIEQELRAATTSYNEASSQLQSKTAEQQSLESYAKQFVTYSNSLTQQKAAQETMIAKLRIDTEQRTTLYDALAESLRTAQQQDVAHRIDEVGRETDAQAEGLMLQAGVSASNKIAGMLEAHEAYMRRSEDVERKGKIAQETFHRRFSEVMRKVESGRYTTDEA